MLPKTFLAALCAATAMTSAHAAEKTVTITFDREMLNSLEGVEEAYGTLYLSARRSCRDSGLAGRVRSVRVRCQVDLMDQMVDQIDHPRLSAFHGRNIRLAAEQE